MPLAIFRISGWTVSTMWTCRCANRSSHMRVRSSKFAWSRSTRRIPLVSVIPTWHMVARRLDRCSRSGPDLRQRGRRSWRDSNFDNGKGPQYSYSIPLTNTELDGILVGDVRMRNALLRWVVLFWIPGLAGAAFRAAVVKVDITPEGPQWLLGYDARQSKGVHDRIYHRIVAMHDGQTEFILLSSELALISPGFYDELTSDLERETGIRRSQVW